MRPDFRSTCRRAAATTTIAMAIGFTATSPASAHVDVEAEGAQAGTGPVTLVFSAESESSSAGIVGVKTQLPPGISPADVSLAGGPAGWALTPTTDGFEVAGPDIGPGVNAEYSVAVAQLPADRTVLVFPTLQRYSDGREDAWIEPVTDAVPDPQMPAPALTVAPAPPGAATAAPPTSAPTPSAPRDTPSPAPASEEAAGPTDAESSTGTALTIVAVLAVLALISTGYWAVRRRRAGTRP